MGTMGLLSPEDNPFQTVGGLVDCVQNRKLGACTSPSEVYPAGKLQWLFTVVAFAVVKGLIKEMLNIK